MQMMRCNVKRHGCRLPPLLAVFFLILTASFPSEAFSWTPEVIEAAHAVASGSATPRQEAIAFQNNKAINQMALRGDIPKDVYDANQSAFEKINDRFVKDAAAENGLKANLQQKNPDDPIKPGTDTDVLVERGTSEKPITSKQIENTVESYNRKVEEFLQERQVSPTAQENWARRTDTDFMPVPSHTTPDEFARIAAETNQRGGTMYTDPRAAEIEAQLRSGGKIDLRDSANYVGEMQRLANEKLSQADDLDSQAREIRRSAPFDKGQANALEAEAQLRRSQAGKYVERIDKVGKRLAEQHGVAAFKPQGPAAESVAAVSHERGPQTARQAADVGALGAHSLANSTQGYVQTLAEIVKAHPGSAEAAQQAIARGAANLSPFQKGELLDYLKKTIGDEFARGVAKEMGAPPRKAPLEGGRKPADGQTAEDRAGDRAKKVEKISLIVDALQFVECLQQEGKDVTACLKEAAGGLYFAEGLSKGIYVLSLVSEKGAVIATGSLSVAGLGATIYFTGVKLGEAAYEAMEYLEARQREKAALAGMEDSQRARVQNLALQLEKLEAQVNRFIAETVARKEQILADLGRYEQLAGIMKEATAYRDRQGQRLATLQAVLTKAAPPCQEIQGTGESLRRRLEQAGSAAQQVEALLRGAQKSVKECGGQEALDKGNASCQEAEKLVQQNREAMRSLETDRRNLRKARTDFQAALREVGGEVKLDEAREVLGRLEAYAAEAEAKLVDIVEVSDRVVAIASDIEARKSGFKGEIQNFKYAFPEQLTREWVEKYGFPREMAANWLARLDKLEKTVAALQPMGDAAWREKRMKMMAENPALGAEAKLFIQEVRQRGPRLKGMADSIEACLSGGDGVAGATEKTIEAIDTERTLGDLAFAKLGKEYLDLRTACTQKLGGRPAAPLAGGPAPAGAKKETLFVLQEGYPQVNPDKAELKNITVDPSGLTAELREKNDRRWGRSECDQQVRFTFGRPPSVLKPEEVFEITFLGKWTGEEKKLCESYGMAVSVNPHGREMPPEGSSTVGLVRRLGERGNYIVSSNREARMTFRHAAPSDTGKEKVLDIDLMLGTGRMGIQGDSVLRYRYAQKDLTPDEARTLLASRAAGTPPAPAEGSAGRQPEDARPETLAAGLLLLEMLTGDVTIYFGGPAEAQPLKSAGQIKPGATLQAGRGSEAVIKTPGGASLRIGENSKVKMAGQEAASKKQVVEVLDGTVEVNRKEDLPGFDDVKIRTRDSQAWATQTRYRVRVTERGTTYEVMEGAIHVTGQMLAKTNADFQVVGKYSFEKEMDLHAGEKAIAFKAGSGQAASPPSSPLPAWAAGGGTATAPAAGLSRPESPQWNDPKVQALMDEWLRAAIPTVAAERPGQWRFSEWGQVLGPGSVAAGAPDHPAGWSRHQSLWAVRDKFDSLNLCTMGQYIERRLKGEGVEGCAKPGGAGRASAKPSVPAWLSPAATPPGQGSGPGTEQPLVKQSEDAVSRARQQLAEQKQDDQRRKEGEARAEQERIAQKQRAAEERQRSEQQRQDSRPRVAAAQPLPKVLADIEAIPETAWINGRADFSGTRSDKVLIMTFVDYNPRFTTCGEKAAQLNIPVVALTVHPDIDYRQWGGTPPPFPIAVGDPARPIMRALEAESRRKGQYTPMFAFSYLLNGKGELVQSGPCWEVLGIPVEDKKRER